MQQIIDLWNSTWVLDPELKDIVDKLREKGFQLIILSNSDHSNSPVYKEKGWYSGFYPVVLSHELGIIKPEPEIFHVCFRQLEHPPQHYIFVDDALTNIKVAEKLGLQVHYYKNPQEFLKDLREKYGIVID